MGYATYGMALAVGLFAAMLVLLEAGRRLGLRQRARDPDGAHSGLGPIDGAVFALLGLLIAFTFSGAASRFDDRRQLIVAETNMIGTAWLRIDLLPASAQPGMRERFRNYLDARLDLYRKLPDREGAKAASARADALQAEIWRIGVAESRAANAHPDAGWLLLPALNEMFDIVTTRTMAMQMHPPLVLFALLFGLACISAVLGGYGLAASTKRRWLHGLIFAASSATAMYVILDLEFPRLGFIRVDAFDQALVELRQKMD